MHLRSFLSKPGNAFGLLTVFYISFMFLPRVVPQGMFVDGLLYSSISRNLAEGRGSWWLPFFSNSYWIKSIAQDHYYENPPLFFWMQSVFFRAFGDHWWVEKLYASLLLMLNCFLISRIWKTVLKNISNEIHMSWLPVLFFYLIPIVFWGSPNNLMDSQLLTFCLLAVWALVSSVIIPQRRWFFYGLAIICIFLGILVKGPVAMYPVAFPFFYFLVFDRSKWRAGISHSILLFAAVLLLFTLLLWVHPPALNFFSHYWKQRLGSAIMGGRDEGVRLGLGRLYIGWILLRENSILIGLSLILFIISFIKRLPVSSLPREKKWAWVFLWLAFAGTLPLMLSTRQAAMYLIPSLVMFAMSAALFQYGMVRHLISLIPESATRLLSVIMIVGLVIVIIFSSSQVGKPIRDIALLEDIEVVKSIIPKASSVGVCDEMMRSSGAHVYLQRYMELELTSQWDKVKYIVLYPSCLSETGSVLREQGYKQEFIGKKLSVYSH